MSFFASLFKRTWQDYFNRAKNYVSSQEHGQARGEILEAIKRYKENDPNVINELNSLLENINASLFEFHYSEAERLAEVSLIEQACDRLDVCRTFTDDKIQLKKLDERIMELLKQAKREQDELVLVEDDEIETDSAQVFELLLHGLEPKIAKFYRGLGSEFQDAYLALVDGDATKAIAGLTQLIEAYPDSPDLHFELGRAYLSDENIDKAEEFLRKAYELAPDNTQIMFALTEVCWEAKKWSSAEEILQKLLKIDNKKPDVYYFMGQGAIHSGSYEKGLLAVDDGIAKFPKERGLMRVRGILLQMSEREDEAIEQFEKVLASYWHYDYETEKLHFDSDVALNLARLLVRRKENLDRAIELYHSLLNTNISAEQKGNYLLGLAMAYELKGDLKSSTKYIREATLYVTEVPN